MALSHRTSSSTTPSTPTVSSASTATVDLPSSYYIFKCAYVPNDRCSLPTTSAFAMQANQAQIEADAALARRLQEEEFSQASLPHLPIPPQVSRTQSSPPAPPLQPATQHPHQSTNLPHYPQPRQPRQNRPHNARAQRAQTGYPQPQAQFPFARGTPEFDTGDMLDEMFNRLAGVQPRSRALDSLSEFGAFPGRERVLGGGRTDNRQNRSYDVLSQTLGEEFADAWLENSRFVMMPTVHTFGGEAGGGMHGNGGAMEMMNMLFSGAFQPFTQGMGGMRGMEGINSIGDMVRAVMQGGEGGETYEDWLNMIERMGGSVNRGATDDEVGNLRSEKFEKKQRSAPAAGTGGRAGPSSATRSGSDEEMTDVTDAGEDEGEQDKCAVCLGEYEDGEQVKTLPCMHMFHTECVDHWLKLNRICPVCKQSIRERDRVAE